MRWITVAASDADIRGAGKSQLLTRADLDVICEDRAWLTDALINYGVEECDAFGVPLGTLHNGVLWIRPTVVKAGKDGDAPTFDATLGQALGWQAPHDKQCLDDPTAAYPPVVLFPVNTDERHWSLCAFYRAEPPQDCRLVHYDSLKPANTLAAQVLAQRLYECGFLSQGLVPIEAGVPRQEDGYNCGSFVIEYARAIMALGLEPPAFMLEGITSMSAGALRETLRLSLQPLVARVPYSVGEWWQRPKGEPSGELPVALDPDMQRDALLKIHRQLERENDTPLVLSGIEPCLHARSTVRVVVGSIAPATQDVEGGYVTFGIEGQSFRRPLTFDGERFSTHVTLNAEEPLDVSVRAKVHPGPEFVKDSVEHPRPTTVDPGTTHEILLDVTPLPARRLHVRFLFETEEPAHDGEGVLRRPFPKGMPVVLRFDDGALRAAAITDADGSLLDGRDGQPGVRIPYRARQAAPEFSDAGKPTYLAWDEGSVASAPTALIDDPSARGPEQLVGFRIPQGIWSPLRGSAKWELPELHGERVPPVPFIDVASGKRLPGSAEELLDYVLLSEPPPLLMNGHVIEHVVCLMLENRGFDHFMGFLYEGATKPQHSYPAPGEAKGKHAGLRLFEGLEGLKPSSDYEINYESIEETRNYWLSKTVTKTARSLQGCAKLRRGARASNIPTTNPHEDFIHILHDMYGPLIYDPLDLEDKERRATLLKPDGEYRQPTMDGFAQNFCDGILHHRGQETVLTRDMVDEIMEVYLPEQLPVMSGLARHYAVSDLWFCSVPSQTNTNRAFWCSGHAAGIVKNDYRPAIKVGMASDRMPAGNDDNGIPFERCLFDVLNEERHTWKYYYSTSYPPILPDFSSGIPESHYYFQAMFPRFKEYREVDKIDAFFADAKAGKLPRVSYIEPLWGGGSRWDTSNPLQRAVGNEFHPVQDVFCGELFVKQVYDAVVNGAHADTTLLIVTFDENGGTYDHFPPWRATPPDRGEDKQSQFGFEFDCFGVRVPTLLISKYIRPQTVFRSPTAVPFDHTSVIATVLKWLGVDKSKWRLGKRVENAPTFDGVLQGTGEEEAERRTTATGLARFDAARALRVKDRKPISFGEPFLLRYRGNKWADEPSKRVDYVGNLKVGYLAMWPRVTSNREEAICFRFGPATQNGEPVTAGRPLLLCASGFVHGEDLEGHVLAASPLSRQAKVELTKFIANVDGPESYWIPWLINDRVTGLELSWEDEIYLMNAAYEIEKLKKVDGVYPYDPYHRLTVDAVQEGVVGDRRLAIRAGEWDLWSLEPVDG